MNGPQLWISALLLLCACGPREVRETYSYYDSYARQARSFQHVVACDPSDRSKVFVGFVEAIEHDERAIHLKCKKPGEPEYFVLIEPNENGFDCVDDNRSEVLSIIKYQVFCKDRGYPILFSLEVGQ